MEPPMPTVTGRSRAVDGSPARCRRHGVEVPHRGAVAGRAGAVREVALDLQAVQPLGRERHLGEAVGRGADAGRRRREDRLGRVHRLHDRACASARRAPLAGHRGLCRITRIRGSSRLITRSAAPAAGCRPSCTWSATGAADLNPNTVLKAYRELEHKGLAGGRPGLGTFIEGTLSPLPLRGLQALRRRPDRGLDDAYAPGPGAEGVAAPVGPPPPPPEEPPAR